MKVLLFGLVTSLISMGAIAQQGVPAQPSENREIIAFCNNLSLTQICMGADTIDHAATCDQITSLPGSFHACITISRERNLSHDAIVTCAASVTTGAFKMCLSKIDANYYIPAEHTQGP